MLSTVHDDCDSVSVMTSASQNIVTIQKPMTSSLVCLDQLDAHSPFTIQSHVMKMAERWHSITPIAPDIFLAKLLNARGYDTTLKSSQELRTKAGVPTENQIKDYDQTMVTVVRTSNINGLKQLRAQGRCMSACNRFSESIVHMACRRANIEMVDFILSNGGNMNIVDDYGRTPLHDACWRMSPQFDIVTLLLDQNLDLINLTDVRGAHALKYVAEDQWLYWCVYLYYQKDKYWPIRTNQ